MERIKKHSHILIMVMMILFAAIFLVFMLITALGFSANIDTISPKGHQPIKAKVINEDPSSFTINVKSLTNWSANDEADTFAVYTTPKLPRQCGNFLHLNLKYTAPKKYYRQFDLSHNPDVLEAIKIYHCVVLKNIPLRN